MPIQPQTKNPNSEAKTAQSKMKTAQNIVERVAKKQSKPEEKVVPTEQLVTFGLDQEEYAAIITDLREIIRIPDIIPIPGAPPFISGILNLRGQIVVVVDLEKRFKLERTKPQDPNHIIIAEVGESVFGIIVDEVTGVIRVPKASIKPAPSLIASKIQSDYLKGVVVMGEQSTSKEDAVQEKPSPTKAEAKNSSKKSASSKSLDTAKATKAKQTKQEQQQSESRLLLLLDVPKMLSEKELLEFGKSVQDQAGVIAQTHENLEPKPSPSLSAPN
jgi:purine-binding chemotaxis protein CheW